MMNSRFARRLISFGKDHKALRIPVTIALVFYLIFYNIYVFLNTHKKKLIAALPVILLALREGRLVIIDELDAKLHPKLLRYVILLFKNKEINRHGAQLLFTSHDMSTMKNTVFRRDEIWFAADNEAHESDIYSLHEMRSEDGSRIKNTATYDKQYLEGRYGADPYLQNMLGGAFA